MARKGGKGGQIRGRKCRDIEGRVRMKGEGYITGEGNLGILQEGKGQEGKEGYIRGRRCRDTEERVRIGREGWKRGRKCRDTEERVRIGREGL